MGDFANEKACLCFTMGFKSKPLCLFDVGNTHRGIFVKNDIVALAAVMLNALVPEVLRLWTNVLLIHHMLSHTFAIAPLPDCLKKRGAERD